MATYTSTQNGNWNAPATWGGSGYPSAAGDVVNIGHTVTYNVSSATQLGAITINSGGVLTFSTAMSTKLTLGNVDLAIMSGGELRVGGAGAPVPKQYLAQLVWNTTSDNAAGLYVNNGGKLTIYGDPDYYGSLDRTVLAADWTAGRTFQVVGNFASKWAAGAILYIHKGAAFSNYSTDINNVATPFTIASLSYDSGTDTTAITINESAPGATFKAGGRVVNAGRNVQLSKSGASTDIGNYNSNRPRLIAQNTTDSPNYINLVDALFTGFFSIDCSTNWPTYQIQFDRSVWRNGYCVFYYGGYNLKFTGIVISCNNASIGISDTIVQTMVFACPTGYDTNYNNTFNDEVLSTNFARLNIYNSVDSGYCYANSCGYYNFQNCKFTGHMGYNSTGVSMPNVYDCYFGNFCSMTMADAKLPANGLVIGRNYPLFRSRVASEHDNQVAQAHHLYDNFGDIVKTQAEGSGGNPIQRSGGSAYVSKVTALSNCSATNYLEIFNLRFWAARGTSKAYRFYLQTDFAALAKTTLVLYVDYLDQAAGGRLATVSSSASGNFTSRADNSDWSQYLEVSVTPAQDGYINLYLRLMAYESGKTVWVDPLPANLAAVARWSYGEVVLEPVGQTSVNPANYPSNIGLLPLGVKQVAL
jgi:hypothetical protein